MWAVMGCGETADEPPDLGPAPALIAAPIQKRAAAAEINPRLLRRFRPLRSYRPDPDDAPARAAIALGKQLFFDARLSRHGDTSCNTCHPLDHGGADGHATSLGDGGKVGRRNAPSVYNAAWHVAQFWDGRAADLEEQAKGPLLNPTEMAMLSPPEVTAVLRAIPGYAPAFAAAFPAQVVDFDHAIRAIAAFERTLSTPGRWDRYLAGDATALTPGELDGLKVFADVGCVQCHTGELVGGSMFQKVGLIEPWPNQQDQGRFEVTHLAADRMVFKVPSLRNVAITAPYFHDGSVDDLPTAVREMGEHQLGVDLSDAEIASIVQWLGSLTGEGMEPIAAPALP
jgi:cytochrome c peroxidase